MRIAITGGSGFIGSNLIEKIPKENSIVALSRAKKVSKLENVNWIQTDLYSYGSICDALCNIDIAFYLVHSMLPASKLFQGNFQDTDLYLADNFIKACVKNNVKQVIYLGGLVPEKGISKHLESRREVEEILKSSDIPVTILRTGMVVGNGGSSFEILKNLVLNLPVMILPKWTETQTQVIFLDDLIGVMNLALNNKEFFNQTINVVNGECITYEHLIRKTGKYFSYKKRMLSVPVNYTSFSKLWIRLFGHADYELVSPLVDSLLFSMPELKISSLIKNEIKYKTYESMLAMISKEKIYRVVEKKKFEENTVRSIQRLNNRDYKDSHQVTNEYVKWLPKYFLGLIKVEVKGTRIVFSFLFLPFPLLVLKRIIKDELPERSKLHIVGGLLSRSKKQGWLEFRLVANGKYTLASINEFRPSLPWYIYCYTQAIAHLRVMNAFSRHLSHKE